MYLQHVVTRFSGQIVVYGMALIISSLSVRIFGLEAVGRIGFILASVGIFSAILNPGFSNYFIRNISQGQHLNKNISNFSLIKCILIPIFLIVTMISYYLHDYNNYVDKSIFFIAVIYFCISSLDEVFSSTLIGKQKFVVISGGEILAKVIKLIVLIILALVWKNIIGLAFLFVLERTTKFVYYFKYTKKEGFRLIKPDNETLKKYFSYTLPIMFSTVVGGIFLYSDKLIVGYFINAKAVGLLTCALAIFGGVDFIIKAITNTAFPKISRDAKEPDEIFARNFFRIIRFNSFVAGVIGIQIFIFSDLAVTFLYGQEASYSSLILKAFILVVFGKLFIRPYGNLMYILEKHKKSEYINSFLNPLLTIGLYILLIPDNFMGLKCVGLGAVAIPVIIGFKWFFKNGILFYIFLRKHVTNLFMSEGILIILTSIFAILLCYLIKIENYWLKIFVQFILANGIFLFICYSRKVFNKKDYQYLRATMAPVNIYNYFKKEMFSE